MIKRHIQLSAFTVLEYFIALPCPKHYNVLKSFYCGRVIRVSEWCLQKNYHIFIFVWAPLWVLLCVEQQPNTLEHICPLMLTSAANSFSPFSEELSLLPLFTFFDNSLLSTPPWQIFRKQKHINTKFFCCCCCRVIIASSQTSLCYWAIISSTEGEVLCCCSVWFILDEP